MTRIREEEEDGTICQVQSSVTSYFRFRFTAAYKYILFCFLRRGRPGWS